MGWKLQVFKVRLSQILDLFTFGKTETTIRCEPCGRRFKNMRDFRIHLFSVRYHSK